MTENPDKITEETGIKRDDKGRFIKGTKPAPGPGRTKGTLDFDTYFKKAVKKVANNLNLEPDDVDVEILIKGLSEALGGSYNFWKDIVDRRYGKVKENINVDSSSLEEMSKTLREFLGKKDER